MKNRLKLAAGIVASLLLLAGAYVYAKDCCGSHDKHKAGEHNAADPAAKSPDADKADVKADPDSPDGLLKTADKILADVNKTKPPKADNALMAHSQKMLAKALEMTTECNQMLVNANPDTAKTASLTEASIKLAKKSVELMAKYHALMPKAEKAVYACPMNCETSDKPGKCSKCGMNLEKK